MNEKKREYINRVVDGHDPVASAKLMDDAMPRIGEIMYDVEQHRDSLDVVIMAVSKTDDQIVSNVVVGDAKVVLRIMDRLMLTTVVTLAQHGELTAKAIKTIALRMNYLSQSEFISEEEFVEASNVIMPHVAIALLSMTERVQSEVEPKLEPEVAKATLRDFPKPPKF